ncbi:MAG TPA: hypothetical protein VKS21_05730 [Spirochaetota bacterium]|nr:hypothetical protein [Spirochaetota bacterium]
MKKKLFDIIKFYQNSKDVKVEIFCKNGSTYTLDQIELKNNYFLANNQRVPNKMVSHAEISAA